MLNQYDYETYPKQVYFTFVKSLLVKYLIHLSELFLENQDRVIWCDYKLDSKKIHRRYRKQKPPENLKCQKYSALMEQMKSASMNKF